MQLVTEHYAEPCATLLQQLHASLRETVKPPGVLLGNATDGPGMQGASTSTKMTMQQRNKRDE